MQLFVNGIPVPPVTEDLTKLRYREWDIRFECDPLDGMKIGQTLKAEDGTAEHLYVVSHIEVLTSGRLMVEAVIKPRAILSSATVAEHYTYAEFAALAAEIRAALDRGDNHSSCTGAHIQGFLALEIDGVRFRFRTTATGYDLIEPSPKSPR